MSWQIYLNWMPCFAASLASQYSLFVLYLINLLCGTFVTVRYKKALVKLLFVRMYMHVLRLMHYTIIPQNNLDL